ncbi:MAG: sialate O-acetylesterase [Acidobacteriota bacterium]|nr:sialate O-acetylesterase [Acidobacteriota bacterium]
MSFRLTALLILALAASVAQAEVRLPKQLSSHMVLQRDQPIHIWGWADSGEKVSVTLESANQTATADRLGHWSVYLPPRPAGGPFQLTIAGTNKIVLDDVLSGDVWFASGQSNMEMPLKGFPGNAVLKNSEAEIRNATQPNIRLLFVPHKASDYPLEDVDKSWTVCTPESATNFSAVAYFFARDLTDKEHVPIGLIDSTWGGTPGEAWVSLDGLSSDASLMPVFHSWADMTKTQADVPAMRQAEKAEDAAARAANRPPPHHPWHPDPESWAPAGLYNGMVAPAVQFPIKGVIWYQGESNSVADRAPLYEKVFSALIGDWRMHWHEGNFPFLFVQISSFKSSPAEIWPIVREAQRRTLALTNTAMAVTIDAGDPDNVHPADKQTVGARLALGARALAYHETVEYSGPMFREATIDGGNVRVWFDHVSGGLVAKGGELQGFEVAGADRRFTNATGRIDGSSVLVTAAQGILPKYVRYGWANAPTVNLFNGAGLPASPFTSEDRIPAP